MTRTARVDPDRCYVPGMITVEQARTFLLERARPLDGAETVPVAETLGRVTAEAVRSDIDVPGHDNSAMDGYAVRSADLGGGDAVWLRVTQRIAAGETGAALGPGEAARIFTGAPVPAGADAVVMQERCETDGDRVRVPGDVAAGTFVRPRGNDIPAGAGILPAGTRIRAQEMGLLASVGRTAVRVVRRPVMAVFSSGDELVAPGEPLPPGAVYNSNRYTLRGLVEGLGCAFVDLGTVADDLDATRDALERAAGAADVVVTSGGMSVGEEDHVRAALEAAGRLELWRVAVKPGKPLAYGRVGDADFLGLPGNPVSTLVTFCLFVRPFVLRRLGVTDVTPAPYLVRAGFDWTRPGDRREFLRARLEAADGEPAASLHPRQGSDVLASTAWATGLVEVPDGQAVSAGDRVRYYPFSELLG